MPQAVLSPSADFAWPGCTTVKRRYVGHYVRPFCDHTGAAPRAFCRVAAADGDRGI